MPPTRTTRSTQDEEPASTRGKVQRGPGTKSNKNIRRISEHSDSDEVETVEDSPVRDPQPSQQRTQKRHHVEIPPAALKWAEKGLYDLPAIPNIPANRNDDDDENAALFVKMVLFLHHKKDVFTKTQLSNQFRHHSNGRCDFEDTMLRARKTLYKDFGYVLVEIQPGTPLFPVTGNSDGADRDGAEKGSVDVDGSDDEDEGNRRGNVKKGRRKQQNYILINTASPQLSFLNCGRKNYVYQRNTDAEAAAKLSLLTLTLLYVFMEEGDVSEDLVWGFLKPYGFEPECNHPLVGNVKTLMNSFIKTQYIVKNNFQRNKTAPELSYFRWGPRADLEYSKLSIVKLCGKVFGVPADAEHFGERYINAVSVENLRLARIARETKIH